MMNYEEFRDYTKDNILDYLPERYENAKVTINTVVKNNDTVLDGIQILTADSNISPVIYVNRVYESYQNGMDVDEIVEKLADRFSDSRSIGNTFDIGRLEQYDQVKEQIVCRLVNKESNEQRLSNVPFTSMEDLAVTYHIMVSQNQDEIGSILITNAMMERYGVDTETLHAKAVENMPRLAPIEFKSLNAVIMEIMTPDFMVQSGVSEEQAQEMMRNVFPDAPGPDVYCLTNTSKINGASCIVSPEVQEYVSEQLGGDFFILPSSVHELLVVSKSEGKSYEELQDMVQQINQDIVSPEEILSDHVYEYDAKTHQISRADKVQSVDHKIAAVQENAHTYGAEEKEQNKEQKLEQETKKHSSPKH